MEDQNNVDILEFPQKFIISYDTLCRFCLCETKSGLSINDKCMSEESKDLDGETIYKYAIKLKFIKMEGSQKFPSQICENCFDVIKICHLFNQVCKKSDTLLRGCIKSTKPTDITTNCVLNCDIDKLSMFDLNPAQKDVLNLFQTYQQKLYLLSKKLNEKPWLGGGSQKLKYSRGLSRIKCENCSKTFTDEKKLKRHVKVFHKKSELTDVNLQEENNICLYCIPCKEFGSQEELLEHIKLSHNEISKPDEFVPEVFVCKDCDPPMEFATSGEFVTHTQTFHEVRNWSCTKCEAAFLKKEYLYQHMKEKHNRTTPMGVKCPEPNCPESFATNRQLLQHGISVHQKYFADYDSVFRKVIQPPIEEERKSRDFECDICERKYIYKSSLRKHILSCHLGMMNNNAVVCPYCSKTISSKLNLKSHIELVHEALFVYCPICKKKINFKTIGKHYKTHKTNSGMLYSGNIYLCSLCGKILKSKRSFEDHQTLHNNIRNELCDICGRGFTTKKFLRFHKRIHEGPQRKVYKCEQCEKEFNGRHTLNRHLLTHSGKKNFICEICSKCFYTLQELKRHVGYHKKDYKFECKLCEKKFLDKSRFRHHMMKHRNVRPHKCQFCDKMFIVKGKMNSHMAAKHNVKVKDEKKPWKDPDTYVSLDDLL